MKKKQDSDNRRTVQDVLRRCLPRSMNKKKDSDNADYNPNRLYQVHEHGMRLNYDELLKQPGFQEKLNKLKEVGWAAIQAREERLKKERFRENNASGE